MLKPALYLFILILLLAFRSVLVAEEPWRLEVIDSVTGVAISDVTLSSPTLGAQKLSELGLHLPPGANAFEISAPGYRAMSTTITVGANTQYRTRILLDPNGEPAELSAASLMREQREDSTIYVGFVVDETTSKPLEGVAVSSYPSGTQTTTDRRGFFKLAVPLQTPEQARKSPAQLAFEKNGYRNQHRLHLELSPRMVWKYSIRLSKGSDAELIDEANFRRMDVRKNDEAAASSTVLPAASIPTATADPSPQATAATNSTVRVPRNIRVLQSNGTTVDYLSLDTYTKHVLPAEWIASWGNISGGSNSLNAGAVAVRCYAIVKLNGAASTSAYDICGTTSCQVYNPTLTSGLTDSAVNFTANWVVINTSGAIVSTEYSAENNSLGNSCGDSFTEPSVTGPWCIYDPVCGGETRSGHGRGMCQWGTAKWATGRKMTGNVTSVATTNGFPRRDWIWIVRHYYPANTLVKGSPLMVGDDVKARVSTPVHDCGGTISNGIYCTQVATKMANSTGVIIGGPIQVTADASGTNGPGGFTWYQIQWSDLTTGWSQENYLERLFQAPSAPSGLAGAAMTNQITLTWTDTSGGVAQGFRIERAISASGPWLELTNTLNLTTSFLDKGLQAGATWYYRVRAFNAAGNSGYSGAGLAVTTSNSPPVIAPITTRTVHGGTTVAVTNVASGSDFVYTLTDFEPFTSESSNAVVVFRDPRFSGSTSTNIDTTPNLSIVGDVFPAGNSSTRALHVSCNFTNASNPWLRLTTGSATYFPNPVIDFTKKLRFSIYTDKSMQVAVGCRESSVSAGTAFGADGGTTGAIEWAGVTNVNGNAPVPARTIAASNWVNLTFDFPNEPVRSFSGGNGILSTTSGLGTLEHIALVPLAGTGVYNVYLDTFQVVAPRVFTYALAAGAPGGASINVTNGIFTWTPPATNSPVTNQFGVIVSDNNTPSLKATNTFSVVVMPAPSIGTVSSTNGETTLSWTAIPGTTYRIQYRDDLNSGGWTNLVPDVTANTTVGTALDTDATEQRFYRVLVVQ